MPQYLPKVIYVQGVHKKMPDASILIQSSPQYEQQSNNWRQLQ